MPESIIIPAAKADIYRALMAADEDVKAVVRTSALLHNHGAVCNDCDHELEAQIACAKAVRRAMAALLGNLGHRHRLDDGDYVMGRCLRCGEPIYPEGQEPRPVKLTCEIREDAGSAPVLIVMSPEGNRVELPLTMDDATWVAALKGA